MYVSDWIIGSAGVLWFLQTILKSAKATSPKESEPNAETDKSESIRLRSDTTPRAYRLSVTIAPEWGAILRRAARVARNAAWNESVRSELQAAMQGDCNGFLTGRKFQFTEFYEPASGLIVRIQREQLPNGNHLTYPVSEFKVFGRLVPEKITGLFVGEDTSKLTETDFCGASAYREQIEISESEICLGSFDDLGFFNHTMTLFRFPLDDVFHFLYCLGRRHSECEDKAILKWPDYISRELSRRNIRYKVISDHNAHEKPHDRISQDTEFLDLHGNPVISAYGPGVVDHTSFVDDDSTRYTVSLNLFKPGENQRLRWQETEDSDSLRLRHCPDCRDSSGH